MYDPATERLSTVRLDSGEAIFQLTGPGSLQRPDAGYALMQAIKSQNIDDDFTTVPFFRGCTLVPDKSDRQSLCRR